MSDARNPERSKDHEGVQRWPKDQALELWEFFAGIGGADKNIMVTVASWLLGFSAAILGYIVTELISSDPLALTQLLRAGCLALLGLVTSVVAWYVVILYGGYANWNWAQADEIASDRGWKDLRYDGSINEEDKRTYGKRSRLVRFAERRALPRNPRTEFAPIFLIFARLALAAALVQLLLLIVSIVLILKSISIS